MTSSSWRDYCRPIIARVLKETQGAEDKEIRKALHDAYPFGQREYHPYKIWLDEIQVQRGLKKKKQSKKKHDELVESGQIEMPFGS
jgi:hypothetical protein